MNWPLVLAIVVLLAILFAGYRLFASGKYHIAYLSLAALFPLVFLLNYTLVMRASMNEIYSMEEIGPLEPGVPAPEPSIPFSTYLFGFLNFINAGLFFILAIASLVNPFISKNKLAVKIVSIVMLLFCGAIIFLPYMLSHLGKIGG